MKNIFPKSLTGFDVLITAIFLFAIFYQSVPYIILIIWLLFFVFVYRLSFSFEEEKINQFINFTNFKGYKVPRKYIKTTYTVAYLFIISYLVLQFKGEFNQYISLLFPISLGFAVGCKKCILALKLIFDKGLIKAFFLNEKFYSSIDTKLAPAFYQVHESTEKDGEFDTVWDTFKTIEEAHDFISKYNESDDEESGYKIEKVRGIPPGEYFIGDFKWFINEYPCAKFPANNETNILPDGTIFANFKCKDGPGIYKEEVEDESILSLSGTIGIIPLKYLEFNDNELDNLIEAGVCLVWEFEKCLDITYGREFESDIGIGTWTIQTNLKQKPSERFSSFENSLRYWMKDSQLKNLNLPEKQELKLKGLKYFYYENSKGDKSKPIKVDEYGIYEDIDGKKYDCQSNTSRKNEDLLISNITQSLFGENIIHKAYYGAGFREIGPFNNPPNKWISSKIDITKISKNKGEKEQSIIDLIIDYGAENISYFLYKDQRERSFVSKRVLIFFLELRLEFDLEFELKLEEDLLNLFKKVFIDKKEEIYQQINNKLINDTFNPKFNFPLSGSCSFSECSGWNLANNDWVFTR